jgi:hypothetical protein
MGAAAAAACSSVRLRLRVDALVAVTSTHSGGCPVMLPTMAWKAASLLDMKTSTVAPALVAR